MTIVLRGNTPPDQVQEQFYQARKKIGDESRNLPDGARPPIVNDEYSDVTFAVYALKGPGVPERLLVRQAETLRSRLLHVSGGRVAADWNAAEYRLSNLQVSDL